MLEIEKDTTGTMREIAQFIESKVGKDKYGFMTLIFEFNNNQGVGHYISNADRRDMIKALREKADILENNLDIVEGASC